MKNAKEQRQNYFLLRFFYVTIEDQKKDGDDEQGWFLGYVGSMG